MGKKELRESELMESLSKVQIDFLENRTFLLPIKLVKKKKSEKI